MAMSMRGVSGQLCGKEVKHEKQGSYKENETEKIALLQ